MLPTHDFDPAASNESRVKLDHILQMVEALETAHGNGIIHRDLKPANIMVGSFGEVQVMDWGLAKKLGEEPVVEDVDELADGFSLHAPSVGTGRTTWQGVQALTRATAYADCGVGRRLRGEAGDEDRDQRRLLEFRPAR